jgi:hypothetical protein
MDIDGVDIVIHGPGRTSLSLLARTWLEDSRFVGMGVNPDFPVPVAESIRVVISPAAVRAALEGINSFHAQIDDEEQEGSLSSMSVTPLDEFSVHDYRATLGGAGYRVIAVEDPFPLLLIPVVVGICAVAAGIRNQATMNQFRDLARDCMNQGGTPTIVNDSGASVTFDGRMKVNLSGKLSFTCVIPQANH